MAGKKLTSDSILEQVRAFEQELQLRKRRRIGEKVFADRRLRLGIYGQRYDSGQRFDGEKVQTLQYPCGDLKKGPDTLWDAPGMQRIRIPMGRLRPEQLEVIADLAEEYSTGVAHVTTRQDIQLHFIHIEDTPAILRRLAGVDITTQDAGGNSVRNITACAFAGVCPREVFDVTPWAAALTEFLLGHPDTLRFGRKFKISFSGCGNGDGCGLAKLHDIGLVAKRSGNKEGFEVYVGGSLGPLPFQGQLLFPFVPLDELFPFVRAAARIFAKYGEKKNRARARLKFLIQNWGMEKFKEMVLEEMQKLEPAPEEVPSPLCFQEERETLHGGERPPDLSGDRDPEFLRWLKENVFWQKQPDYAAVTVALPLGDISSAQLRALADIARKYSAGALRTTAEQNIMILWIRTADLPGVYRDLKSRKLPVGGARTIEDITACPGTATCRLGIASSLGLAKELRRRLQNGLFVRWKEKLSEEQLEAVRRLRIKISGCPNSCAQHHIADIGFYGVSRKRGNHLVPHFQLVLGGNAADNAASFGQAVAAVPARRVPDLFEALAVWFAREKLPGETFAEFYRRTGKTRVKSFIEPFLEVPEYVQDPEFYRDWGDVWEFTIHDLGTGECAGQLVSPAETELSAAERELFEAQSAFEAGGVDKALQKARRAVLRAIRALLLYRLPEVPDDELWLVRNFKEFYVQPGRFLDRFSGGRYSRKIDETLAEFADVRDLDKAGRILEEAQLFIESAYQCYHNLLRRQ